MTAANMTKKQAEALERLLRHRHRLGAASFETQVRHDLPGRYGYRVQVQRRPLEGNPTWVLLGSHAEYEEVRRDLEV